MITNIHIENFKSIQSLDLELGRLNIFIGANGSGKSNILEAIAMGSAAMEDKLDDEFLVNRGVRVTDGSYMISGFSKKSRNLPINLFFTNNNLSWKHSLMPPSKILKSWTIKGEIINSQIDISKDIEARLNSVIPLLKEGALVDDLEKKGKNLDNESKKWLKVWEFLAQATADTDFADNYFKHQFEKYIISEKGGKKFLNFLIYAPENHFLRRFEEEAAIKPLGIKGEGLFKLITIIAQEYPEQFAEIKQHLKLIDWFEDFEIPTDLKFTERRIKIKDQYLADDLQYFDQRSANEGFLYLLFYLTLFVSDLTPHFFAIDNIDNSLNPKLGSELVKVLAQLAKKHNKQALLTTHNPVILDGLDLTDDDQRLFVVYRNADGHTKVRRVPPLKQVNGVAQVRLSEAFIRGYIGGLPDNF
jgi:AAA15 family ATPase/GTPase